MDPELFREQKPRASDVAELPLFKLPQPPSVPVDTSELAADLVYEQGTAQWYRVQAMRCYVARNKGLTDAELQDALGMEDSNSVRPRRWDLEQQKLVRCDKTVKRTYRDRKGQLHRPAHPYVATEKGERCLRGLDPWPWAKKREDAA